MLLRKQKPEKKKKRWELFVAWSSHSLPSHTSEVHE